MPAAACKCGVRLPIDLLTKNPWDNDADGEVVVDAVMRWVIDAWRAVRNLAPDLRGFISEHDGGEMIDLDSGQVVPEDHVVMGPRQNRHARRAVERVMDPKGRMDLLDRLPCLAKLDQSKVES